MQKVATIKKIATTQIKRKLRSTKWVALSPGDRIDLEFENITMIALPDNTGTVYARRTEKGWVARGRVVGDGITLKT